MKYFIYFLINRGELAYIGSSKNVKSRLIKHRYRQRKFDSHVAIELNCDRDQLEALEAILIDYLKPSENGRIWGGRKDGQIQECSRLPMSIECAKTLLGIKFPSRLKANDQ